MTAITLAISLTALFFSISGFVLGLLGLIQAKATEKSTHTIQLQEAPQQQDLSELFNLDEKMTEPEESFSVSNDKLEETLLRGFE